MKKAYPAGSRRHPPRAAPVGEHITRRRFLSGARDAAAMAALAAPALGASRAVAAAGVGGGGTPPFYCATIPQHAPQTDLPPDVVDFVWPVFLAHAGDVNRALGPSDQSHFYPPNYLAYDVIAAKAAALGWPLVLEGEHELGTTFSTFLENRQEWEEKLATKREIFRRWRRRHPRLPLGLSHALPCPPQLSRKQMSLWRVWGKYNLCLRIEREALAPFTDFTVQYAYFPGDNWLDWLNTFNEKNLWLDEQPYGDRPRLALMNNRVMGDREELVPAATFFRAVNTVWNRGCVPLLWYLPAPGWDLVRRMCAGLRKGW